MADDASPQGTFETREDAGEGGPGVYKLWTTALDLAGDEELNWRKRGRFAIKRYRDDEKRGGNQFNILYSSVETQAPAIYNSVPKPDVRRRFGDEDPVGKVAAQAFERTLSHSIDEYDFDTTMQAVVHDSLLPGRGIAMVVYDPTLGEDGEVADESVRCDHVQWDDFRRGPARKWADVPWIAIRSRITREEATALSPKHGPTVTLDHSEFSEDKKDDADKQQDVFKRLTVWKIWDKAKRKIVFIAPSFKDGPFAETEDLLGLRDFFPMPRPIYDVMDSGSLIPQVPFDKYKDQAAELDTVTARIKKLVSVLKWRGIRPAHITELDQLKDADDGELIPSESFSTLVMSQGTRPDQAIWLMPIEKLILVIRELLIQREAIKGVIFEITGISDIQRGDTDPRETLGAQQIKAEFGSGRMQRRQREVQRFARDLIRIKAEIIGEHFSAETLAAVTGIQLPTPEQKEAAQVAMQQQAAQVQQTGQPAPPPPDEVVQLLNTPTWDDVKKVMASDALRSFRVDIETDSTIQADLSKAQQNMSAFVEGLAAFGQAMGPAIESGIMPLDIVADLFTGFARNFKLGRQAEDALDRLGKLSEQPQQEKPDPEAAKAQADAQLAEKQLAAEQQKAQAADALAQKKEANATARKAEQIQADLQATMHKIDLEAQLKREAAEQAKALDRDVADHSAGIKQRQQDAAEAGETRTFDASQGQPIADQVQAMMKELAGTMEQINTAAEGALAEVQELKAEAAEPITMTVNRKGGKITGGTRQQGARRTDITLN